MKRKYPPFWKFWHPMSGFWGGVLFAILAFGGAGLIGVLAGKFL